MSAVNAAQSSVSTRTFDPGPDERTGRRSTTSRQVTTTSPDGRTLGSGSLASRPRSRTSLTEGSITCAGAASSATT